MKTISMKLSETSISSAIKELRRYKKWLNSKTKELQTRVAEEVAREVSDGFASALLDDLIGEGWKVPSVSVSVQEDGVFSLVIASGEDAVWVEFGTGVYHNTTVGTSPHPKGSEFGLLIGTYGKGHGSRKVWGYYDTDGELKLTRGTPAQMPMYNAVLAVGERIGQIAKEVFANG